MMTTTDRRTFLKGLLFVPAAPAIVRFESIMPVKLFTPWLKSPPVSVWNVDVCEWRIPQNYLWETRQQMIEKELWK